MENFEEGIRWLVATGYMEQYVDQLAEKIAAKLKDSPQYVRDESEAWRVLRLISELETTENGIYTNAGKVMKQMALNALAAHGDIGESL